MKVKIRLNEPYLGLRLNKTYVVTRKKFGRDKIYELKTKLATHWVTTRVVRELGR